MHMTVLFLFLFICSVTCDEGSSFAEQESEVETFNLFKRRLPNYARWGWLNRKKVTKDEESRLLKPESELALLDLIRRRLPNYARWGWLPSSQAGQVPDADQDLKALLSGQYPKTNTAFGLAVDGDGFAKF